jgi:hypothetical protein
VTAPQFALDLGARRRDEGHASALSHFVVELIQVELTTLINDTEQFTSDDLYYRLSESTQRALSQYPNCLGAVFTQAAKANRIEMIQPQPLVRTKRPEGRRRRLSVWRRRA